MDRIDDSLILQSYQTYKVDVWENLYNSNETTDLSSSMVCN